jgi:hypothetical protein
LDLRGKKWREVGEDYIMRSFITCTLQQVLLGLSNHGGMRWAGHVARIRETRNAYNILVGKPDGERSL